MASLEQTSTAESQSGSNDPIIGRTIGGKYKVTGKLGGGGMGAVYRAEQEIIQRVVAIKILHTHLCNDDSAEFMKRFQREATIASRIDHPNAITMYDFGIEDGSPYIVMQYAEGRTLKSLLLDEGPLSLERVEPILHQICSALSVAHESGIIHRDLKPDNIMVSSPRPGVDRAQVLDFGIAKPLGVLGGESGANLTRTGTFMGTPKYMAPEQALEKDIDVRCDVYSLGVIIYEMITGEVPFDSQSPMEILLKHVHSAAVPAREFKPELDIPQEVSDVVTKALEKDPLKRFPSVKALADAFSTALELSKTKKESPKSGSTSPAAKGAENKTLLAAAGVFSLLIVAALALLFLRPTEAPIEEDESSPPITTIENTERPAVALMLPGQVESSPSEVEEVEPEEVETQEQQPAAEQESLSPEESISVLAAAVDGDAVAQTAGIAAQLARLKALESSSNVQQQSNQGSTEEASEEDPEIAAMSGHERREAAGKLHDEGRELMEQKEYLKAGVLFKRALGYQENHLSARLSLGVCLLKLGKPEHALTHFKKALEIDKQYAPTYYNLASYYAVTNQPQQSVDELKKAIKLYPRIKTWLKDDADFNNIRDYAPFQEIANFGNL